MAEDARLRVNPNVNSQWHKVDRAIDVNVNSDKFSGFAKMNGLFNRRILSWRMQILKVVTAKAIVLERVSSI